MLKALSCPLNEDLAPLAQFLRSRGVVHRIAEERGEQVVWVVDEASAQIVRSLYEQGVDALPHSAGAPRPPSPAAQFWRQAHRLIPVTLAVLAITAVVALLTGLGSDVRQVVQFTFTPLEPSGYLAAQPDMSQWWRLITPIFLHFGVMHLAFNALWYWELGRRIEMRSGGLWLLGLTLLIGLVSNTAQWLWSGNSSLFGGLSGVLYGLLGYCWLYQKLAPNVFFDLPRGVIIMMLAWLVLCMTGLITLLGFGAIANAAHVSGFVTGCLIGAVAGALQRQRQVQ
ncbi:rhomboid family intramembrane serine protease [Halopseudomonas maritima]|uniref:rhomboid family intramembrane serine protease n=1 Tax=Halopseudomonas maritima TaxID=2918528 RepID=UPI001EEBFE02|nr:rhomboid family intramembrane serine protease [Halopseudomonas maritima]UJJ31415.1 rhomboid family intramembrane serine protease [Halopseudomonas maritima]